jgi:hypothetical protein
MDMYESKIVEQSGLRYKIQLRKNEGIWQQRHIWYPCEHSQPAYACLDYYREDEWIKSTQGQPDSAVYSRIS